MARRNDKAQAAEVGRLGADETRALAVVRALMELGAFAEEDAVHAREIAARTGCDLEEVVSVCRDFVASAFAICEVDTSTRTAPATMKFYLEGNAERMLHKATSLNLRGQHLLGKADLLKRAATGLLHATPMWMGSVQFDPKEG